MDLTNPRWMNGRSSAAEGNASGRRLQDLGPFVDNPGNLSAKIFIPESLAAGAPLVVVLHGCTQSAEAYDRGSGWSEMAQRCGFALLYPEQKRANNPNLCFNWFDPMDMVRDGGEPTSIRNMIDRVANERSIDASRIFITGLSAGAAMANVMLATSPELFAGGGLIAGLPYGVAASIPAALQRMREGSRDTASQLGSKIRGASDHPGPWPSISVWHGTADATVNPANADAVVVQWLAAHGLAGEKAANGTVDGYPHRTWQSADGSVAVESYSITGMGHGTPLSPNMPSGCGRSGPFLLDAGISSTQHLARSWGLRDRGVEDESAAQGVTRQDDLGERLKTVNFKRSDAAPSGVQKIIEDALKSAGLLR